jgi:hypothetical protein
VTVCSTHNPGSFYFFYIAKITLQPLSYLMQRSEIIRQLTAAVFSLRDGSENEHQQYVEHFTNNKNKVRY